MLSTQFAAALAQFAINEIMDFSAVLHIEYWVMWMGNEGLYMRLVLEKFQNLYKFIVELKTSILDFPILM